MGSITEPRCAVGGTVQVPVTRCQMSQLHSHSLSIRVLKPLTQAAIIDETTILNSTFIRSCLQNVDDIIRPRPVVCIELLKPC